MVNESIFKNEKELVEYIVGKLRAAGEYKEVYSFINLAKHKPDKYWPRWYGAYPLTLQPEIDLLLVSFGYGRVHIEGIEVKYIVIKEKTKSYYAGIEQSLSILRFGVDRAWLWHFFDQNVPQEFIVEYVGACYGIILYLQLPIGYSAYLLEKESPTRDVIPVSEEPVITPISVLSPYYSRELIKMEDKRSNWWRVPVRPAPENPLLNNPLAKDSVAETREFLRLVLGIPSK